MQLQYLNGISTINAPRFLYDSVQHQLLHTRADVDSVVGGFDLDNYQGLNTAADTEKIRAYLVRTKKIADQSPALIQSTRNPETFSQMCAYILQYWDTAEREQAALLMAQKEKQLFAHGMIRRAEGDEFGSEFFKALYMMLRPQSEIAGLCGTVLKRAKGKLRASVATARNNNQNTSSAIASTIRRHRRNRTANTPNLSGINDPMDELTLCGVVYGLEDEYTNGDETNRRYLTRLHNAIDEAPTPFFDNEREARAMVSGLGSVLDYWDNSELRNIALTQAQNNPALSPNSSALFGFLKKAIKKVGKGIKKAAQTVAKGVKTAAKAVAKITKKIGKKIAKVAKKVVKFLIRFNPVTAIMRAILCLCARCNWFSLASKCYPGSLTEAEALKLGITKEQYDKKYKPSYNKFKSVFEKIGGKESKLKSRLKTGYSRKAKGDLNSTISKSSITKLYEEGEKEAKEEITDEKAQLKQEGAVEDSTVPAGEIVKTQVTVEVAANAITTTAAASLYESTSATKVLANIPANTSLLYDTATNNATYYNVNYGGQNGYVKKSLCRAATDAEAQKLQTTDTTKTIEVDAPVSGLFGFSGLGYVEPVTLSAIAGTVTTITGLVATVAKAFGKDKVANAAETVSTTAQIANGIKQNIADVKSGASSAMATVANGTNKLTSLIDAGKQLVTTGQNAAASVKQTIAEAKQPTASAPAAAQPAATSKFSNVLNKVQSVVENVAPIVSSFTQSNPDSTSSNTPQTTTPVSDPSQNPSQSSFSVALTPTTKKYLIIGGVALAGGLAAFALTRKR